MVTIASWGTSEKMKHDQIFDGCDIFLRPVPTTKKTGTRKNIFGEMDKAGVLSDRKSMGRLWGTSSSGWRACPIGVGLLPGHLT